MRALCDSCSRPQPRDWKSGDHCIWCGESVRRELRCFWCANWTPAVKFCRTCGAGTVDSSLYGAARMLKDAQADRFSIPRLLAEFAPDQIENFTRIYQEHAAIAAHHVGQVEFLENNLQQKNWSASLEEELTPQLPWPRERLEELRAAAKLIPQGTEGLTKARLINQHSPFRITRVLATIVRLAFDDWMVLPDVKGYLSVSEPSVRIEAVLAISHWRVLFGPGLPGNHREVIEELQRCPFKEAASTRLALLGVPDGTPLPPGDFATALAENDAAFLTAALREPGEPLRRYAAAQKLIGLGVIGPVAALLRDAPVEHQLTLLELLERRRKSVPELRDTLSQIAAETKHPRVHRSACSLLCLDCPPDEALQVANVARGERIIYQTLLQKAGLPPDALEELGAFLLRTGAFHMDQYGMNEIAKRSQMPANFVQRHWRDASGMARIELCKFAELQLGDYGDESLHHFLVDVAFAPGDVNVQSSAWTCLYRWYDSFGYPRRRPLAISSDSIAAFFGSPADFLLRFTRFLEGREILLEHLHRDTITGLLSYPDPSALIAFATAPRETLALADALTHVMWDVDLDLSVRLACTDFLGFLGCREEFRKPVTQLLKNFRSTDLDLQSTRALERMAHMSVPM